MHTPSPQQQAVLDWVKNGKGSLNLVARAGCGKTSTLMMVCEQIPAKQSVQLLAFNRSIAEEIKLKVQKAMLQNVNASTIHSVGLSAWKGVAPKCKVEGNKVGNIVKGFSTGPDDFYSKNVGMICRLVSIAKQSAFGFLTDMNDQLAWATLVDHHGIAEDLPMENGEDQTQTLIDCAIKVFKKSLTQDRDVIDFDDMILAPLVHGAKFWQKDWVLLDEAQDTNASRRAIALKLLKPKTGRLIAVGDNRQAIYGFTGADSIAMDLIKDELQSTELYLTVTYRCPKAVVAEANKLVPDLMAHESAPEGNLHTHDLITTIGKETKPWFIFYPPSNTSVILCRNTKPLIEQAYTFLKHGIGCRVEGREIGEGLIALANRWKSVRTLSQLSDKLYDYQMQEMQKWMEKGREEKAQQVEDKVGALQCCIEKLVGDGKNSVSDLVQSIRSLFGDSKPGEVSRVVTLSTIHKSKGREWDTVYLLNRAGTLPSKYAKKDWQKNQEENLEYVAITRSKNELIDLVV